MTSSLGANTRLKLEQALGQWSHWRCQPALLGAPHIEKVLGNGISNHSVLVGTAGQRFVVRIDGINPAANGINRQNEWYALQQAHAHNLAPCARYFNPELGALVCDYLQPDARQQHELKDVAQLLRKIHQLPQGHHRLDIGERIRRYERKPSTAAGDASREALRNCRDQVSHIVSELRDDPTPPVLCHNDLLAANRLLSGGRLWALDWEYSAMASPWCDLAFIISGDELTATQSEELVEQYLQRAATPQERQLLQDYLSVCRYLELLWYQAQSHADLDEESTQRKLSALIAGLER